MVADHQGATGAPPAAPAADLNTAAEAISESDDGSQDELSASETKSQSTVEANQAKFEQHIRATATATASRGPARGAPRSATKRESDSIIGQAREYQQELFDRAKDENVIAVLDTGSGKTLIAALLIRHFLRQEVVDRGNGKDPKIVFFLVNSVHLARQQARFLENNLDEPVVPLFGDANDDLWKRAEWESIFADKSVVVCTAAVLEQCLWHRYLTMGQISLLVFDEAHHCKKNHPYSIIIRNYYLRWQESPRPRIFGMTASPVDSRREIGQVVNDLEALLQSKIVTTNDLSVFDFAPRARDEIWEYPPLQGEFDTELVSEIRPLCGFVEDLKKYFTFSRWASKYLGGWAADRVWKYGLPMSEHEASGIIKKFERSSLYSQDVDNGKREAALESVNEAMSIVRGFHFGPPIIDQDRQVSPKVMHLHTELRARFAESSMTRGIVFVDQRFTALILCDLFQTLKIPNLRPGLLVGVGQSGAESSSWRDQETVMERFRTSDINLIFATNVAEEGIDIPQCNLVIRFDLYKTPIQYMQSRGRARMKDSVFAHMIEQGVPAQKADVDFAMAQDEYIRQYCRQLAPDRLLGRGSQLRRLLAKDASCQSFVTSSGAVANYSNSLLLLSRYIESLQKVGAVAAEVYEEIIDVGGDSNVFRYKVILPPADDPRAAKVKGARGDAKSNKVLARRSAAWHCCFKLRQARLLDENLDSIFVKVKPANSNARTAVSERKDAYDKKLKPDFWLASGAGSPHLPTKLFVVHIFLEPRSLSMAAGGFLLLTRSPLPEIPKFTVFVDDNVEKQVVFDRLDQPVSVTADQLEALTKFTLHGVFADVFNKTYRPDSSAMSYWLGPPAKEPSSGSLEGLLDMDQLLYAGRDAREQWTPTANLDDARKNAERWCRQFLVDPGRGKYHYFTETILPDKSIWDPPPASSDAAGKKHHRSIVAFTDSTWRAKGKDIGIDRYDPRQPVYEARLIIGGRNYLERCPEQPPRSIMCHIAPQPLERARVSYAMAQMCQLLPAVVHRLEAYLIVDEAFDKLDLKVPLDLALEAFTQGHHGDDDGPEGPEKDGDLDDGSGHDTTGPSRVMNYERLEFVGDALLKLTTTATVYARTTCDEEGMHCRRMALLSNRRLWTVASAPPRELFRHVRAEVGERWRDTWYPEFLDQTGGRKIQWTDKHRRHALKQKTIADVCEAVIGACVMTGRHLPTAHKFDLGIQAITKLVEDADHAITGWRDVLPMYTAPAWSLVLNDPVANDLATKIHDITGYRFKRPCLVRSAFTHSSDQTSTVPDLQRLEFLGDACLDWVCIWYLFSTNPSRGPQWLTEHKMAMVSNKFLAALAVVLGFHKLLWGFGPHLYDQIGQYAAEVREAWDQTDVRPDFWTRLASGHAPPKALADLVESYLGAVLVDSGFDFGEIERFFERHVKWFFEDLEAYDTFANRHPTTHLGRLLNQDFRCRDHSWVDNQGPERTTTHGHRHHEDGNGDEDGDSQGSDGDAAVGGITVHVGLMVHGHVVAESHGRSKKYAKVRASRAALKVLGKLGVDGFRQTYGCGCGKAAHEGGGGEQGDVDAATKVAVNGLDKGDEARG